MPNLEELSIVGVVLAKNGEDVPQGDKGDEVVNINSNLKHLNLKVYGWQRHLQFPISWSLLFDHFPKIETLTHDIYCGDAIASLVTNLESNDEIVLKVLKIHYTTKEQSASVLRLVQVPKLKLRRFDLTFRGFHDEENQERATLQTVKTALKFQGEHLESLVVNANNIIFEYDESEPMNNFPFRREPLQNLTSLEFSAMCPNFHFLQQTPNLKYLRLFDNTDIKVLDEADMEVLGSTKLPFLSEFYFYRRLISENEMKGFVKMMPNVERFHAFIDAGAFRIVCEHWRQLRELAVPYVLERRPTTDVDYIGDGAVTGIVEGREERRPNITDLHCLETLKMMSAGTKVGDASIWNGFLKLSTLRVSLSPKTSDEAYAALVTRFPEGNFNVVGRPSTVGTTTG